MPTWEIEPAGFDVIAIPSGTTAATDGRSAVYILQRTKFGASLNQEVSLRGVAMELRPADTAGAGGWGVTGGGGANQAIAWGDTRGLSACIIVAKNLPGQLHTWTKHLIQLPGIENNATASRSKTFAKYPAVGRFPTGKWSDTTPNGIPLRWSWAPDQHVIRKGDTLDVALVVNSSQIVSAGATRYLVGFAEIGIHVSLTVDLDRFGNAAA